LSLITHKLIHSQESASTIDKRLLEIQQSLFATQNAIQAQSDAVSHILWSVSSNSRIHQDPRSFLPLDAWQVSGRFFAPPIQCLSFPNRRISETCAPELIHRDADDELCEGACGPGIAQSASEVPDPAGLFELSHGFFPELYIIGEGPSSIRLLTYCAYEEHATALSRTNSYLIFFSKCQRQWQRLTLSITISRKSRYWNYTKLSASRPGRARSTHQLPPSLQAHAENFISEIEDSGDGFCLSLSVSEGDEVRSSTLSSNNHTFSGYSETSFAAREALELFRHMGCRQYFENEIVQLAIVRCWGSFATCVEGQLRYEHKISFLPNDQSIYTIQLLHCLNGIQGIAKFIGIVVDSSAQYLKSFLVEMPGKGWMRDIISKSRKEGKIIPWPRRERWAKDIVASVSQVHSKGFVIGTLYGMTKASIAIDNMDRALLCSFQNTIWTGENIPGYLPPEYLRQIPQCGEGSWASYEHQMLSITPHCDIFHIGLLLWSIASNQISRSKKMFCDIMNCQQTDSAGFCSEHTYLVTLPTLADDVPQYYKNIVAACRHAEPNLRPSAGQLLEMFPSDLELSSQFQPNQSESNADFAQTLIAKYGGANVFCDTCGTETSVHFFHCSICRSANFDLCSSCFNEGLHCNVLDHFLAEMIAKQNVTVGVNNYYSSVRTGGQREISHL
jgi:hypothetical protein